MTTLVRMRGLLLGVMVVLGCNSSGAPAPREQVDGSPQATQRAGPAGAADKAGPGASAVGAGERENPSHPNAPKGKSHDAFVSALCPYPKDLDPVMTLCSNAARERLRCLEQRLKAEQLRLPGKPEGGAWQDMERFYGSWQSTRCALEEAIQWVEIESREWSFGSRMDKEDLCHQRMVEERLFLHANFNEPGAFWDEVERRQAAGRRAKRKLKEALATALQPPVKHEEPFGSERPEEWRVLLGHQQESLTRPAILAQQHCRLLSQGPDCEEKLEMYFHSIPTEADARSACR